VSFDALTLAAMRAELEPLLTEARMQKLVFADELTLGIETFAPHSGRANVLLSADPNTSRVQRVPALPARGIETESPFSLVVRKHLRNARIRSIRQPRLERVLELDCEQRDASGQHYRVLLIVEAMGRRSNLVLVDTDHSIIDAARRSPPSRNARRPVLPHLPYVSPPPQERLFPEELDTLPSLVRAGGTLAKALADHVAGLSPLAARELAFRATGRADAGVGDVHWPRVIEAIRAFVTTSEWHPCVAFDGDQPLEYAPFELTHMVNARIEGYASISAAMDVFYARPVRQGDPLAAERKALLAPIERALSTTERRVASLEHQLVAGRDSQEALRRAGELILTYQADIQPKSEALDIDGEAIALDPDLSPSENAQSYFGRYRKAREAEERVPALLDEARNKVAFLGDLRALVDVAESMEAIRALRREVSTTNGSATRAAPGAKGPYRRIALADGWDALVGNSATGNATVTFDIARADDLWLHARGVPGAHVILAVRNGEPPEDVLERAAQLAAWYSSARASGNVEVDIVPRRYVKKVPSGPPGLVRYTHERTVRVTPAA
jgi:predicted ribosome quality control (RQC) complex YloA/Tae2 family protein